MVYLLRVWTRIGKPPARASTTPAVIREKSLYIGTLRTNAGSLWTNAGSLLRYAGEVEGFPCSVTTHSGSGIGYARSVATYARRPRT
jgi:hypothetical protein